jgi:hypothetical protein
VTICAFYVAGSKPTSSSCVGDVSASSTEKYVTYNWGKSGSSVTQSTLGWVSPTNSYNRGCKSQNGAHCLSQQGWKYTDILKFYYGMDIQLVTTTGPCVNPTQPDKGVLPPDKGSPRPDAGKPSPDRGLPFGDGRLPSGDRGGPVQADRSGAMPDRRRPGADGPPLLGSSPGLVLEGGCSVARGVVPRLRPIGLGAPCLLLLAAAVRRLRSSRRSGRPGWIPLWRSVPK